jgi:hypothetical protein
MTDRELSDFELVEEGRTYREWLIPAEVIDPPDPFTEVLDLLCPDSRAPDKTRPTFLWCSDTCRGYF